MSKFETRRYRLFGNVHTIWCVEIKITYEKCDTSKIIAIAAVNLLTRSSPVELDADRKNQKFEKCFEQHNGFLNCDFI